MKKKGFTLVELLAVIAILAILVIIALPNVLKLFTSAKVNTFKTEAIKAAQLAEQKFAFSNEKGSINCKENLTGGGIKECTAVKQNNKVYADVLGDGAFSGYLMVNASSDGSGEFVDLNKLNTLKTPEVFNERLIKSDSDTKINSKFTKLSADEMIKVFAGEDASNAGADEKIQAYKKLFENSGKYSVLNGYLKYTGNTNDLALGEDTDGSDSSIILGYYIDIPKEGTYLLTLTAADNWKLGNESLLFLQKDLSDIGEGGDKKSLNFEYVYANLDDDNKKVNIVVKVKKADKYKVLLMLTNDSNKIKNNLNFVKNLVVEEQVSGDSIVLNNADKDVYIKTSEVKNYKDDGLLFGGVKLTKKNDFYAYSKLQSEEGVYTYNYIVKTTNGIKKLSRIITVSDATSGACFGYGLSNITFKINTKNCINFFNKNGSKNAFGSSYSGYDVCEKPQYINELLAKNGRPFGKLLASEAIEDVNYSSAIAVITDYYDHMYDNSSNATCPKDVVIPSYLSVGKVTVILENAANNKGLTGLTIPATVNRINSFAFASNKLNSVTFKGNRNNISIDSCAFINNSSIIGNEERCVR